MTNPYLIEGPAVISFSGGRTSGYMLWHVLDAYDGKLPDDVHVCFANTGKEREETLRFVHECETRWGVRVRWLEFMTDRLKVPVAERFAEVGYNSASRAGEPFDRCIARHHRPPNSMQRFCTEDMKVDTIRHFMLANGYSSWANVIGLRADEMLRVFKAMTRNAEDKSPWQTVMPMASRAANVSRADVLSFWQAQPFDLSLKAGEGNCDLCFLKGRKLLKSLIRANPSSAVWWDKTERETGGFFNKEGYYRDLVREVASSPLLPLEDGDEEEFDAECGLWCAGEAA